MRLGVFLLLLAVDFEVVAQTPQQLWTQLAAKRESLSGLHQEFEVLRTQETSRDRQSATWDLAVDMSKERWRETATGGFVTPLRVFDGKDVLSFRDGEQEYIRTKWNGKDSAPVPGPYEATDFDWPAAIERGRSPCVLNHLCVQIDVPFKQSTRFGVSDKIRVLEGSRPPACIPRYRL
jgi:hypothetical protein